LKKQVFGLLLVMVLLVTACTWSSVGNLSAPIPADTTQEDTTPDPGVGREDDSGQRAELLSAFFGLDGDLPRMANLRICRGVGQTDGMPVIFSHEVDVETLQAGDFSVITQSGKRGKANCVTLAPALDPGELRTALLTGEFGDAEKDPPVRVEIVGNILSLDGRLNFKGAAIDVTPLVEGPSLVLAEVVPENQWKLDQQGGPWSVGNGCPTGTRQVVRAVWAGGITKPSGDEVDDLERQLYTVTLAQDDGAIVEAVPFALGDLDDGDNNHLLCLDVTGRPLAVSFPAGYVTDPNEDLNPDTVVEINE
jgi:hypothetical protein